MNSSSVKSCEDFSNDSRILGIDSFREIYLPSISVVGFIGNILTLFVLRKMKDCFHRLLFALALCDLIVPLFCNHLLFFNLFTKNGSMTMLEIFANSICGNLRGNLTHSRSGQLLLCALWTMDTARQKK